MRFERVPLDARSPPAFQRAGMLRPLLLLWLPFVRADTMSIALALLHQPGVVIDVGANGGQQTQAALAAGHTVFAFECLPSAYEVVRRMFERNLKAHVINACVSNQTGLGTLHLAGSSSSMLADNLENPQKQYKAAQEQRKSLRVIRVPLDDLIDESTGPVSLIKVDVQGAEYEVFSGARRLLLRDRPVVLYEDTSALSAMASKLYPHPFWTSGSVRSLLEGIGYTCGPAAGHGAGEGVVDVLCQAQRPVASTETLRKGARKIARAHQKWFGRQLSTSAKPASTAQLLQETNAAAALQVTSALRAASAAMPSAPSLNTLETVYWTQREGTLRMAPNQIHIHQATVNLCGTAMGTAG